MQRVKEAFVALTPLENEMVTKLGPIKEGRSEKQHTFTGTPPHAPEADRLPPLIDKNVVGQSRGVFSGVRMLERVDSLDVAGANGDVAPRGGAWPGRPRSRSKSATGPRSERCER